MRKTSIFTSIIILILTIYSCNRSGSDTHYIKKVEQSQESIAVGIFKATGYDYPYFDYIAEAINIDAGIVYVTLTEADILKTKLDNIDVLFFPAMLKDQKMDKLDDEVAEIISDFVSKKGKGAISLCNGGEILTKSKKYQSLDLVNIELGEQVYKKVNSGIVYIKLTEEGKNLFPEFYDFESVTVDYHYGPEMIILDTISDIQVLAYMDSEIDFPVLITAKCGNGNLAMANIHPEITPGMRWIIPRLIRWSFNKEKISYNRKVFRPNLLDKELNLEGDIKNQLNELMVQLDSHKKDEVISAMDDIQSLYPRIVLEKVNELLLTKNNDIKLRAAKFLVDNEYTQALEDFNELIKKERSRKVKEKMVAYRNELESMLDQN